jgi:hypothetical protein
MGDLAPAALSRVTDAAYRARRENWRVERTIFYVYSIVDVARGGVSDRKNG